MLACGQIHEADRQNNLSPDVLSTFRRCGIDAPKLLLECFVNYGERIRRFGI
jgi:hypothetical protein